MPNRFLGPFGLRKAGENARKALLGKCLVEFTLSNPQNLSVENIGLETEGSFKPPPC